MNGEQLRTFAYRVAQSVYPRPDATIAVTCASQSLPALVCTITVSPTRGT